MYPYQRTHNGKSLYKPYIVVISELFPPRTPAKYHGYTYVRGTPNWHPPVAVVGQLLPEGVFVDFKYLAWTRLGVVWVEWRITLLSLKPKSERHWKEAKATHFFRGHVSVCFFCFFFFRVCFFWIQKQNGDSAIFSVIQGLEFWDVFFSLTEKMGKGLALPKVYTVSSSFVVLVSTNN